MKQPKVIQELQLINPENCFYANLPEPVKLPDGNYVIYERGIEEETFSPIIRVLLVDCILPKDLFGFGDAPKEDWKWSKGILSSSRKTVTRLEGHLWKDYKTPSEMIKKAKVLFVQDNVNSVIFEKVTLKNSLLPTYCLLIKIYKED